MIHAEGVESIEGNFKTCFCLRGFPGLQLAFKAMELSREFGELGSLGIFIECGICVRLLLLGFD